MAKRAHISTLDAGGRTRRLAKQAPQRQVILIVCEGQTEEAYFHAVKQHYRQAKTLNVKITRAHSDPVKVVEKGKGLNKDRDFDRVYCVIDGDKPARIERARKRIGTKDDLDLIVSVPCFEVWLLLHFERSDAPFAECVQVCNNLRQSRRLPDYVKGLRYDFTSLTAQIDTAIDNAEWLAGRGLNNPATDLHRLLTHLRPTP
mgnify:CR=1 FL=1